MDNKIEYFAQKFICRKTGNSYFSFFRKKQEKFLFSRSTLTVCFYNQIGAKPDIVLGQGRFVRFSG